MNKSEFFNKYYNNSIQIHKNVINDIIDQCFNKNLKILVFGLGYDSDLWYNLTNKNTFFIENDQKYIDLNKKIPKENIIKYNYKTTVQDSFNMPIQNIESYIVPDELLQLAPFDIIIIDGPPGYTDNLPGRLLPIYWSKYYLSKTGTIIYVDDSKRKLESHCIKGFLIDHQIQHFPERSGCDKFLL